MLKIVLIITQPQNRSLENIKSGLCFSSFMDHKKQNIKQYWSTQKWDVIGRVFWTSNTFFH